MPSLRKEITIAAPAEDVWSAVRDFGAVHRRVARGFIVDCKLDGDARIVTFANGGEARELLVSLDDDSRRLVYAITNERIAHYNAAVQVFDEGAGRSRVVWTIDLLPSGIEGYIDQRMDEAVLAMKATLGLA
jgi:carbon monoxide dehydrogenase subunit G